MDDTKTQIINEIILPYYKNNIRYTIENSNNFTHINTLCVVFTYFLYFTSSILAFLTTKYPQYDLGSISGILTVIALNFNAISHVLSKINHIKTVHTNDMIKKFGINLEIPEDSINNILDNENFKNV